MIGQAFKLIWNQKGKHLGLFVEIFFSFIVLFLVFSFSIYNLQEYFSPLGYEYENVWAISLNREGMEKEASLLVDEQIELALNSYQEVEKFTWSQNNIPFANTSNSSGLGRGNAYIDNVQRFVVDDRYEETLKLDLVEGRWFEEQDELKEKSPFILTENLAQELFPEGSAIGEKLRFGDGEGDYREIIGVVSDYRYRGGIMESGYSFFIRKNEDRLLSNILLKVNEKANAAFESRLMKQLHQIAPGYSMEIRYIDEMRSNFLLVSFIPLLILGIIGVFLIFNVALGLFGVLWQNISQRKQEIGVRRAMGASKAEVSIQFMLEIIVLASISLVLGIFFAVQFPLLDVFGLKPGIYILAIVFAVISIYLLVTVCALIPSAQAAELHPAIALREE
ncbi:MAG: FtsX-like permease family protein [Bacteroidota bacterium]